MERHVKERLIGAAVLVAAAIILIPEMLSGPDRESRSEQTAPADGAAPLKTYTIDLSKSPSSQATAAQVVEDQAPPPETQAAATEPLRGDQATPESTSEGGVPAPASADAATSTGDASREISAQNQTKPAPEPVVKPAAATPPAATLSAPPVANNTPAARTTQPAASGSWAVQLGSFASRATAERMVKDLRTAGHDAFVMPVKSGAATLYRVRIGPMQDRESAAKTLSSIRASVPAAAIVAHP